MRGLLLFFVMLTLLATGVVGGFAQQRIDAQTIVTTADVNHDGQIDRVEYLKRMSEAFFFVDTNKDGFLTHHEIQQTVAGTKPERFAAADTNVDGKLSMYEYQKSIDMSFNEADTNRDGLISMQEVQSWFSSPAR